MTRSAVALVCVTAIGGTLAAQQPSFRSAVDLVEVDVIVQDRRGTFVSDLAPGDFELQEDGQPQQIQQFVLQLTSAAGLGVNRPAIVTPLPTADPSPPSGGVRRSVFVVVFDDAHMTTAGFKRAQAATTRLFSQHFIEGDVGGVLIGRRMVNNRLTSDRNELLKAIKDAKPDLKTTARAFEERMWPRLSELEAVRIIINSDSELLDVATRRACADDPGACKADVSVEVRAKAARLVDGARRESTSTLQTLKGLMAGVTDLDGRKTLILLSDGFIADETWPLVQETVALAARANVRVYSLDTRGLDRGMSDRLAGTNPGVDDSLSRLLEAAGARSDSTNSLAVDTGGFAIRNANVMDAAIAQIAADAGNYYVLGYRPSKDFDGKFRKISVKVKRPGVTIRARRGYVAVPRPAGSQGLSPAPPQSAAMTAPAAPDVNPTPPVSAATTTVAQDFAPPLASEDPGELRRGLAGAQGAKADSLALRAAETTAVVMPTTPTAESSSALRLRPDAAKHVDALLAAGPSDEAATRGWQAYQRGDVESARSSLVVAAAAPAARPWVHYALGQSEYALRNYAAAIGAWEQVRRSAPEFEPVYFDLLDGYLQIKDYERAVRVMRDATSRWPKDSETFQALGVAQVWRNALDDAVKSFDQAIALAPQEGLGYFNLAKAFELRYRASRRYVQQLRSWVANEADRRNAAANYERYLAIGGSFDSAAREGLSRLDWNTK